MQPDFAPELAMTRTAPRPLVGRAMRSVKAQADDTSTGTLYEAASRARRTIGWHAPTSSPNQAIGNLTTLRDRSRSATRNDGYAKGAIETHVSEMVGTGIKPLCQSPADLMVKDPRTGQLVQWRQFVQEAWLRWTDESDADGLLDFYGQQTQAVRGWLEGGEVFVRLRNRLPEDGLSVPLQVQVIEPELCPHDLNKTTPGGNRVRAGKEFNAIGKCVAVWFYASRPGDLLDYDVSQLRRVSADQVLHLYEPLRAGQLRGLPSLAAALICLNNVHKLTDAKLLRELLANLYVAFLKSAPGAADSDINPLTGETLDTEHTPPTVRLEPGIFQELGPGEDVTFSNPPGVESNYTDFVRHQLRGAMTAAGVPYEMATGDLSGLNDRVVRVILNKFHRHLQAQQHQIVAFQFCRRVWQAWMDRGVIAGTLPISAATYFSDPAPWLASKWIPQGWPYIHPLQDVQAAERRMRNGLSSRSGEVSELGEDAEAIDREQAADNARADLLELVYDSDGRQGKNAAPVTQEEPEPAGAAV